MAARKVNVFGLRQWFPFGGGLAAAPQSGYDPIHCVGWQDFQGHFTALLAGFCSSLAHLLGTQAGLNSG